MLIAQAEISDSVPAMVPIMRTFGPAFFADCTERWKLTTRVGHAHCVQHFILPVFGNQRVDAITARDMRSWFDDLPVMQSGSANRSLAVLSSLVKHAKTWGFTSGRVEPAPRFVATQDRLQGALP